MRMFVFSVMAVFLLGVFCTARADTVDFEGFTPGTVNGQGGWTVEDSFGNSSSFFDEEVVDDGGNTVWRVSNGTASTSYSNQPFSQTTPLVAGETGSYLYNDYGTDHTAPYSPPHQGAGAQTSCFYSAFDMKSATGGEQTGLKIQISPSAKQSTVRMGLLTITDPGTGLSLEWYGTGPTNDPWTGYIPVATGLSYTDTHHIEMMIGFNDGINGDLTGNDQVQLFVNGSLAATSTTWETYYYATGEGIPTPRLQAIDSLLFRMPTEVASLAGGGIFFDNIDISNTCPSTVPAPGAFLLSGIGASLVGWFRRRRVV